MNSQMTFEVIGKIKPAPLLVEECLSERAQTVMEFFTQACTKAIVRVVCIDDNYQRTDVYEVPDGLLERGRIYFASGKSECGGLLLVGLRAISYRTGKEVGFDPSRFRAPGPSGKFSRHYRRVPDNSAFGDDEAEEDEKPIILPTIAGVAELKPYVCQAWEVLEKIHSGRAYKGSIPTGAAECDFVPDGDLKKVRAELLALLRSPSLYLYMNQAAVLWQRLIRYKKPTVLFCRNSSPVANVIFQMCMNGNILSEQLLDGDFRNMDYPILIVAAGKLHAAPIQICDAREPDTFLRVLSDAHKVFEYALCDWTLAGEEAAAAHRLTQDSQIKVLCPFSGEIETEGSNSATEDDEKFQRPKNSGV